MIMYIISVLLNLTTVFNNFNGYSFLGDFTTYLSFSISPGHFTLKGPSYLYLLDELLFGKLCLLLHLEACLAEEVGTALVHCVADENLLHWDGHLFCLMSAMRYRSFIALPPPLLHLFLFIIV